MLALFKSHYSIGKSILTLNHPDKSKSGGPDSIFSIAKNQQEIILVEDSLIGFLQAQKTAESLNKKLIFGLRISCSHEESHTDSSCIHKIIIFAKNDQGCKKLNSIYSHAFCNNAGVLDLNYLKNHWCNDSLFLCVPFYDSFIFMNTMYFCSCIPDFNFCAPTFFIENNFLPFDQRIESKVKEYCVQFNFNTELVKSIYYNKISDFSAYQTYKCICAPKRGKQRTLDVPNIDHLSSPEFCYESYLKYESA
jgi:DNA polymerase III alpha subunit